MHVAIEHTGNFTWTAKRQVCSDVVKQVLSDEDECKEAAELRKLSASWIDYEESTWESKAPPGCYETNDISIYWNNDPDGRSSYITRAICKDLGMV